MASAGAQPGARFVDATFTQAGGNCHTHRHASNARSSTPDRDSSRRAGISAQVPLPVSELALAARTDLAIATAAVDRDC